MLPASPPGFALFTGASASLSHVAGSQSGRCSCVRTRESEQSGSERVYDFHVRANPTLDLSFVGDLWWPLVTGVKTRTAPASIDRRLLEICVVVQVAKDLKSGDLCIPESDKFRDYRTQLLSWEDVYPRLSNYGEQAGVAVESIAFIAQLWNQLEERSRTTDKTFPQNRHLRFENG
jgi:hypothetical protein